MSLPNFSIKHPIMVLMLFMAFICLGLISLFRLPIELYQGQNLGIISIIVRARGGLPPLDVEKGITRPIEEAVATVSHLKSLISNSREAESRVTMEFEPGTDMRFAALEIREKFSRVKPLLPKEIEKPVIANFDDAQSAIMVFALTSQSLNPEEILEIVSTDLKPVLSRVDGVASVEVYGGRARKILVELDRDKMFSYNISVEKVMDILGQSNVNLLAGNVETGRYQLSVRSIGAFRSAEEIGEIGIQATRQGSIIPLKEIATIKDSYMEAEDAARLNLEQNVTAYIKKTSLSKTIPLVKTVREVLDNFKAKHRDLDVVIVTDKAQSISRAIADVRNALLIGAVLTILVIYLFLRQRILAAIVATAIPCSLITTFFFMARAGFSLNVMTLSGLALAIGLLCDSSIVVLENIFVKKEDHYEDMDAIRTGAEEVFLPLFTSLLTTLIVFLPILFIDKKIQGTYSGFAFTVAVSLVTSFFVALLLIPVLLVQWAHGTMDPEKQGGTKILIEKAKRVYQRLMKWNLSFRYPIVGLVMVLAVFSSIKIAKLPIDMPTALEENEFSLIIFPLAGAKLEANDDAVKKVETILSKIPEVEMFSSTVRRDDIKIFVRLKPKGKRQFQKDEIMKLLDKKGNEEIKQIHDDYSLIVDEGASSTEQKKLVVNIFGLQNDVLEKLAKDVASRIAPIPGLTNLVMTDLRKRPEYSVRIFKDRAAVYGLDVKKIANSLHAQVRGMRPTKFHELTKGEEIETITRLQSIYRQKIEDLKFIHVAATTGIQIPLGEIANFVPTQGPQTIDRKEKYRYVFVKGDVKRPLEAVANDVRKALAGVRMPDDYYWRFGGGFDELMEGKSQLTMALILTVFLVYMVMACMFQSYWQPILIMVSVAMASIGIWFSLTITQKPLSQNVFLGMMLLTGFVSSPAIIMMDRMNHLRKQGRPVEEVLVQAGMDRLRPILMTTISTGLGFFPMAVHWGQASDIWSPLAVTVIGGLMTSAFLTLFILPDAILITADGIEFLKKILSHFSHRFRVSPMT